MEMAMSPTLGASVTIAFTWVEMATLDRNMLQISIEIPILEIIMPPTHAHSVQNAPYLIVMATLYYKMPEIANNRPARSQPGAARSGQEPARSRP